MLYHYTSIESLALILSSKKFRFSNFGKLDDLEEAKKHSRIDFSSIAFASCWSDLKEESIPLWKMYTPDMKGIRIGISEEIFPKMEVDLETYPFEIDGELDGPLKMYIPPQIWDQGNIMFFPGSGVESLFKGKVTYVENLTDEWIKRISFFDQIGSPPNVTIYGLFDLVRSKSKIWSFQHEYRFVIFMIPRIDEADLFSPNGIHQTNIKFGKCIFGLESPNLEYFDLSYDPGCLERMEITLGPKTGRAEELLVQALLEKFSPKASLKVSSIQIRK